MIEIAQAFIETSFAAISPAQVAEAFASMAASFGFTSTLIVDTAKLEAAIASAVVFATMPGSVERCDQRAPFLTNPLNRHAAQFDTPFTLADVSKSNGLRESELRNHLPDHIGDADLVGFPVHRDGKLVLYVGCCGTKPEDTPVLRAMLHSCAHAVYDRSTALSGETPLTPRQADCLYWTSQGKTYAEAGCILGLSARTVRAELAKAKRKLGARTKAEAIAKAIARNGA
jgi:DNA-binding CsgD family transcriptional regulator